MIQIINLIQLLFRSWRMFAIFDIASWFLNKEAMPQKKLQKLCYYAQAWYKAKFDKQLINCNFEAWIHGPVEYNLWKKTTIFGYDNILEAPFKGKELPVQINDFLEDVYYTYGEYSGEDLERLTHKEDPWIIARHGLDEFAPSREIIDLDVMGCFYRTLAKSK